MSSPYNILVSPTELVGSIDLATFLNSVGIFADLGLFPSNQQLNKVYFEYNAGIFSKININDEIIGIYLPVLFSENIGTSIKELKVLQRVSFIFNLNNINPFEIKKTIRP